MTFKRIFFTIFAIAITGFCNAQNTIEINYSDTSTLFLNKLLLNDNMNIQDTFGCPIDILCASKKSNAKIQCVVAFKDNSLTQIAFILK